MHKTDSIKLWIRAIRAYSLPASIVPVVVGAAYAYFLTSAFSVAIFLLSLAAGMLYHMGSNLVNDYCDFRAGIDRDGTYGGSRVIVEGLLSAEAVLRGAIAMFGIGTAIGLYFVTLYGAPILLIGVAGLLGAVLYTATPLSAKYNTLGEPLVFIMMGVLMVLGSFVVQTGYISVYAILASLPVAFFVTAILQGNDVRDIADDKAAGISTIAIRLGERRARAFFSLLLAAGFMSIALLALTRVIPMSSVIAMLPFPKAWSIHRLAWRERGEKNGNLLGMVESTAKLHLACGLLYALGIMLG